MSLGETDPSEISGGATATAAPVAKSAARSPSTGASSTASSGSTAAWWPSGEWRDYAIDFLKDRAVFSVFRRSAEVPIYRIEKNPKLARRQGAYSVMSATGLICAAATNSTACCACSTKGRVWFRCSSRHSGLRRCARSEIALHQHAVEPAAELEADVLERADHAEAQRRGAPRSTGSALNRRSPRSSGGSRGAPTPRSGGRAARGRCRAAARWDRHRSNPRP